MNPSDLEWWWEYGLDGFFGGVVTAVAVWATLRHERHERRLEAAQNVAAQLATKSTAISWDLIGQPLVDDGVWTSRYQEVQALALELEVRAYKKWPSFAVKIALSRKALVRELNAITRDRTQPGMTASEADRFGDALVDLAGTATLWLGDPKIVDSRRARSQRMRAIAMHEVQDSNT